MSQEKKAGVSLIGTRVWLVALALGSASAIASRFLYVRDLGDFIYRGFPFPFWNSFWGMGYDDRFSIVAFSGDVLFWGALWLAAMYVFSGRARTLLYLLEAKTLRAVVITAILLVAAGLAAYGLAAYSAIRMAEEKEAECLALAEPAGNGQAAPAGTVLDQRYGYDDRSRQCLHFLMTSVDGTEQVVRVTLTEMKNGNRICDKEISVSTLDFDSCVGTAEYFLGFAIR